MFVFVYIPPSTLLWILLLLRGSGYIEFEFEDNIDERTMFLKGL
jgi:hypothetical protein